VNGNVADGHDEQSHLWQLAPTVHDLHRRDMSVCLAIKLRAAVCGRPTFNGLFDGVIEDYDFLAAEKP